MKVIVGSILAILEQSPTLALDLDDGACHNVRETRLMVCRKYLAVGMWKGTTTTRVTGPHTHMFTHQGRLSKSNPS